MDIDAYAAAHRDQWDRLDELTRRRRLTGAQADELVSLYRASAGHLSRIRTGAPDPELIVEVSARVAAARGRITGTRETRMSDLVRFWLRSAPAALYRVRWWTVGVMIAEIAIAVIIAVWTLRSPEAMSAVGTPQERDDYARSMFESYYTRYEPSDFAVQVWTNNARIAAVCVASGITGILPAYMLFINAFSVGKAAAIMADHDALGLFFALITPHGLLELDLHLHRRRCGAATVLDSARSRPQVPRGGAGRRRPGSDHSGGDADGGTRRRGPHRGVRDAGSDPMVDQTRGGSACRHRPVGLHPRAGATGRPGRADR